VTILSTFIHQVKTLHFFVEVWFSLRHSKSFYKPGENVSSKNGSSRDCPLKLRLEEEEEKVKKDNEMMMRPEPEKSPPNVSPVGINIANDENIKPSKDKEDADSERAK